MSLLYLLAGLMLIPDASAAPGSPGRYRIVAGDTLAVTVYGHPELSGKFRVDREGNIVMPLIQAVACQGLEPGEISRKITDRLKPDYLVNPNVSVSLVGYRPIYLIGEIRNPGSFPFVEGMTVLTGVSVAGGFTEHANKKKIFVERQNEQGVSRFRASSETPLMPGDVIIVTERFF